MRQGGRGEDQRSPLGVLGELEAGVFDGAVGMGDAPDAASAVLGDFDRVELQGMADLDVKAISLWQKRGMAALFNIPYAKSVSKLAYCAVFATPFHAPLLQRSMADCHTLTI